jgi:hypothetical protein
MRRWEATLLNYFFLREGALQRLQIGQNQINNKNKSNKTATLRNSHSKKKQEALEKSKKIGETDESRFIVIAALCSIHSRWWFDSRLSLCCSRRGSRSPWLVVASCSCSVQYLLLSG